VIRYGGKAVAEAEITAAECPFVETWSDKFKGTVPDPVSSLATTDLPLVPGVLECMSDLLYIIFSHRGNAGNRRIAGRGYGTKLSKLGAKE
jgi:hypothetical protein